MPTETFNCGSANGSTEFALPRPYPCCGWNYAPATLSGTFVCYSDPPNAQNGCNVTTPTAFSFPIVTYCETNGYTYRVPDDPNYDTFPFNASVILYDTGDSTGNSPPCPPLVGIGFLDVETLPVTFTCSGGTFSASTGDYSFEYNGLTYHVNVIINGATF